MIKGIDVSGWNAETFATTGLDFVVVKATEGTGYINPKQGRQAATARTAGLVLGFYHFLQPGNVDAQAKHFVDKCGSVEGDFLVCDWETTGTGKRPTNAEKDQFLRAVKKLRPTHKVGLYCNRDYWLTRDSTSYACDFLWIADPGTIGKPKIKAAWTLHQYSVTGGLDRNVAKFADRAAMRSWAAAGVKPTPPKPKPPAPVSRDDKQDASLSSVSARVSKLEKEVADLQQ